MKIKKIFSIVLAGLILFGFTNISYAKEQEIFIEYENSASYEVIIPPTINISGVPFNVNLQVNNLNIGKGYGLDISCYSENNFKLLNVNDSNLSIIYTLYYDNMPIENGFTKRFVSNESLDIYGELDLMYDSDAMDYIWPVGRYTDKLTFVSEIVKTGNTSDSIFTASTDYFDIRMEGSRVIGTLTDSGREYFNTLPGRGPAMFYIEYNGIQFEEGASWDYENGGFEFPYYGDGEYYMAFAEEFEDSNYNYYSIDMSTYITIDSGDQAGLANDSILFEIRGYVYVAENGMTWADWRYNNDYYFDIENDFYCPPHWEEGKPDLVVFNGSSIMLNGTEVGATDLIISGARYE